MIEELMLHGRAAGKRCQARDVRPRRIGRRVTPERLVIPPFKQHPKPERHPSGIRIDWDTPLIPRAAAEGVCEEVTVWLHAPLPRRWVRELTARANTIYAHSPHFRSLIRGRGTRGRDYLWAFMRHWLSGLLHERRQHLYDRLPASYRTGHELPSKPAPLESDSPLY